VIPLPVGHRIKKGATLGATFFIELLLYLYLSTLCLINGTRSRYQQKIRACKNAGPFFCLLRDPIEKKACAGIRLAPALV